MRGRTHEWRRGRGKRGLDFSLQKFLRATVIAHEAQWLQRCVADVRCQCQCQVHKKLVSQVGDCTYVHLLIGPTKHFPSWHSASHDVLPSSGSFQSIWRF